MDYWVPARTRRCRFTTGALHYIGFDFARIVLYCPNPRKIADSLRPATAGGISGFIILCFGLLRLGLGVRVLLEESRRVFWLIATSTPENCRENCAKPGRV